jgi:hypothetical protein
LKTISLDAFFIKPILIDHPTLGQIQSLEEPETIDIYTFTTLLRQIKTDWTQAEWPRAALSSVTDNNIICIVVEGFLLFALSDEVTSMIDIRVFLDSTQARCRMQRFRREKKISCSIPDTKITISTSFACWYDQLVWSEYLKRRDQQYTSAEKIFHAEEYENQTYLKLDAYIHERLIEFI